jgi:(R,R)-butanediol dehydrogenase/meso-butanediol dehydrogenase/diacetyl reductase
MVHVLPAGVGPQQAALVEPHAIAHHAVARWEKPAEGSAAIFGGGPIGIAILLTLKASGVAPVFVVEPAPYRRSLANALGAVVIDPTRGDSATEIRDMTFGHGVDVAFETAGAATTFQAAVGSMAKRGTVVVVSSGHQPVEAPLSQMLRSELTIRTTFASCGDFPPVIELVQSGAFPLDGWVDTIGIDDLLGGFEALRTGTALKLLVDPWA